MKNSRKNEYQIVWNKLHDKRIRLIIAFNGTLQIDKNRNNIEDLKRELKQKLNY